MSFHLGLDILMSKLPPMGLFINIVHAFVTISLALMTGIALTMYLWIVPIIHIAPDSSTKIKQFTRNTDLGARYQHPMSKILPVLIFLLAITTYMETNHFLKWRWINYLAAMITMAPIGPWETVTVFPINDKMTEMGNALEQSKRTMFGDERDAE
ncbi:hypothetical protein B9Z65_5991 [Elsinoe australis]|uniref:Uncharacterized protein n=1 Tax=Elsinoe australis TaxID=40998 RepID=A0A2P7YJP3_9PEZI|nr:hypothetical protein B9Z65_5991 [Elsinoe australis]